MVNAPQNLLSLKRQNLTLLESNISAPEYAAQKKPPMQSQMVHPEYAAQKRPPMQSQIANARNLVVLARCHLCGGCNAIKSLPREKACERAALVAMQKKSSRNQIIPPQSTRRRKGRRCKERVLLAEQRAKSARRWLQSGKYASTPRFLQCRKNNNAEKTS